MPITLGSMVLLAVLLYCVLDVVTTAPERVRNLPKLAWLALVVLLPVVGVLAWFLAGRPRGAGASLGERILGAVPRGPDGLPPRPAVRRRGPAAGRSRPQPPPRGPDDDPAFLRRLADELRRGGDDRPGEDR